MAPFLKDDHINLPHSLLTFLHSPLFKKVSVNIGADFKQLQRDCALNATRKPFAGHVELGAMAKEQGAVVKKNVGLAKLVATLLQKQLPKDPQIRVSLRWADQVLPSKYTGYAVLDAYATSQIYFQLIEMEVAQPVSVDMARGTAIALLAPDGQEVAYGIVALERPSAINGISVTSMRVVMTVSKVLVPSFLMPASLCKATKAIPLSSFGSPPFLVVTHVHSLRVCPSLHCGDKEPSEPLSAQLTSVDPPPGENIIPVTNDSDQCTPTLLPSNLNLDDEDSDTTPEQTIDGSERYPEAEAALAYVMEPYANFAAQPDTTTIRSHVIYDNFHCYNQFPISHHHGLRRPFARALSSAFSLPVAEDKAAGEAALKNFGTTYNSQLLSKPEWVLARVRRYIPPPEILLPQVAEVLKTYGPLKDATTKQPLFND